MVDIVELQYATMLSNRLENFKVKADLTDIVTGKQIGRAHV